jgi:sulfonate transport system substrate-binding protein
MTAISGAGELLHQAPSLLTPAAQAKAETGVVRIGFQKAGTVLLSLKAKRTFEKILQPSGIRVQWSEFPAGLPMVEARIAGAINLAYVGGSFSHLRPGSQRLNHTLRRL